MPRRAKAPEPGKRYPLNMRTTKDLRDKLAEAAHKSGRSLAQEVEFRLERSFSDDDLSKQVVKVIREQAAVIQNAVDNVQEHAIKRAGDRNYQLWQVIEPLINAIEQNTGKRWDRDFETFRRVQAAIANAVSALATTPNLRWEITQLPTIDQDRLSAVIDGLLAKSGVSKLSKPTDEENKS